MRTWGNEGQVLMQFLHFMYAVGALMAPLISGPFLAERVYVTDEDTILNNDSYNVDIGNITLTGQRIGTPSPLDMLLLNNSFTVPYDYNYSTTATLYENTTLIVSKTSTNNSTHIHFVFLIAGIGAILASIPFIIMYLKQFQNKSRELEHGHGEDSLSPKPVHYRQLSKCLHYFSVLFLCSFFFLYCAIENSFSSLLMTFLVNQYEEMSKSTAVHILAIFWSCFASSRFLMIFLAKLFSPLQLLSASISFMFISLFTFTLVAHLDQIALITFISGLVGLSMSGIFASGFSWSESEYLQVTSSVSGCILFFTVLGVLINPLLVVFMMEEQSPVYYCYISLVEMIILVFLLISLVLFNRKYLNKKYGNLRTPLVHMSETNGFIKS